MAHIHDESYDGNLMSPERPQENSLDMNEYRQLKNYEIEDFGNLEKNSQQKRSRKALDFQEITSLHQKKKNLLSFIESLGEVAFHPIRFDILQHCQKIGANLSAGLSRDSVMKLAKNRVQKMIKNKRIKKNWSEEDIKILIWVISKYSEIQRIHSVKDQMEQSDWEYIANLIPGVNGKSCMFKWLSLKKNNLAQNSWAEQESLMLDQMVKKYGQDNWCIVSQELFLKNKLPSKIYRCPKQCREHWNCYLNPNLKKGPWEKEEDILLLRAVQELKGVKKWAQIVKMFNGRTENALKNRFNLIIEKEMKDFRGKKKPSQLQLVDHFLKKHESSYQIDQSKLKFLQERKGCISSKIGRRKKGKPFERKNNKEKVKLQSDEDEYIPDDMVSKSEKKIPKRESRNVRKSSLLENPFIKRQAEDSQYREKEYEMEEQHESLFQSRQLSFEGNISHRKCAQEIFYEDDEVIERENKVVQNRERSANNDEHTHDENINIDANSVRVVSFDPSMLERLKKQFDKQGNAFVPCTINANNFIVSYRMNP